MTDSGRRESTLIVLCATLPLLGELEPLVRQLFVAPLAFLVPAGRELSVLSRVRAGLLCLRLTPDRASTGCGETHRHGDLHLPLWTGAWCDRCVHAVIAITKMRFVTAGMGCPIRQQMCPRNSQGSGLRRYGRRHALSRLERFGRRLNHGVTPSGRSLNPALETFLRWTPGADDIILSEVL